jgi:hypothetical protein
MCSNEHSVQTTGRVPPAGPSNGPADERPAEDGRLFTAYVRRLAEPGGAADRALFDQAWAALRAALRSELRRRSLWEGPPAYLGVYGAESWEGPGEPLEELLADCYAFVFVDRRRSLAAQLAVKDNVDGLVFLNIRHFLHERQREHDPLGFRVFEVLRRAVQDAVEAGELRVLAGDPRVRNDTRLGFSEAAPRGPARPAPEAGPAARQALREIAARWTGDLLPDLVTARGREEERVAGRLRALFPGLRDAGIEAFGFKELVDPLKAEVRERWAALLAAADPGAPEAAVPAGFDLLAEGRESFRWLVSCVQAALDRLDAAEATRGYLMTLWQFLRVWAGSSEEGRGVSEEGRGAPVPAAREATPAAEAPGDELPSQRRLAEQLRIPRERLPGLFGTLGRIVERCRSAAGWKSAVTPEQRNQQRSSRGGVA